MRRQQEKQERHISEFDNHKKLFTLNKPRSPITILFCTNDLPDEWLVDMVEYRTKTGIISDDVYITQKQVPQVIDYEGRINGFTIITQF